MKNGQTTHIHSQYKDKTAYGKEVRIQGASNKDIVFCLVENRNSVRDVPYPMVNLVAFWNLIKEGQPGEIRNIIQINKERAVDVGFKFLIRNPQSSVFSPRSASTKCKKSVFD